MMFPNIGIWRLISVNCKAIAECEKRMFGSKFSTDRDDFFLFCCVARQGAVLRDFLHVTVGLMQIAISRRYLSLEIILHCRMEQ